MCWIEFGLVNHLYIGQRVEVLGLIPVVFQMLHRANLIRYHLLPHSVFCFEMNASIQFTISLLIIFRLFNLLISFYVVVSKAFFYSPCI